MKRTPAALRHVAACTLVALFLVGCGSVLTTPPPGLTFPDDAAHETVLRAVDGDTFELSSSGIIRLVGVDSPESVKPGARIECHGTAAAGAAARLVEKTVRVEIDYIAGERDRYGRRLVYLWYLHEDTWIHYNLEAVANGDARAYAYENQQYLYRKAFEDAEQNAIARNAGLWACN